jgi:hypothetical protein
MLTGMFVACTISNLNKFQESRSAICKGVQIKYFIGIPWRIARTMIWTCAPKTHVLKTLLNGHNIGRWCGSLGGGAQWEIIRSSGIPHPGWGLWYPGSFWPRLWFAPSNTPTMMSCLTRSAKQWAMIVTSKPCAKWPFFNCLRCFIIVMKSCLI